MMLAAIKLQPCRTCTLASQWLADLSGICWGRAALLSHQRWTHPPHRPVARVYSARDAGRPWRHRAQSVGTTRSRVRRRRWRHFDAPRASRRMHLSITCKPSTARASVGGWEELSHQHALDCLGIHAAHIQTRAARRAFCSPAAQIFFPF